MREAGASLQEIAAKFGWKLESARVLVTVGKRQAYYHAQKREYARKAAQHRRSLRERSQ